jgi:ribonuclease-3
MIDALEKKLGYCFQDRQLLKTALTHSSYANENRAMGLSSNERLEFLGDSVLGMVVASHLYLHYPELPEGRMTRLRAELVCEQSLVGVAQELELGRSIRLGKGEEHSGGRQRQSILADCVEAVIAAMYLDGGMDVARSFIDRFILSDLSNSKEHGSSDYKTALQELVQQKSGQIITYSLLDEQGPDHMKVFTAQVSLNDVPIGEGVGHTKKEAEQSAARHALEALRK